MHTHLWWSGAGWLLCSTPQSPSVSERPPPERLCLSKPEIISTIHTRLGVSFSRWCHTHPWVFFLKGSSNHEEQIYRLNCTHCTGAMNVKLHNRGLEMCTLFNSIFVGKYVNLVSISDLNHNHLEYRKQPKMVFIKHKSLY